MKNNIWHSVNELPTTYINIVVKFDLPFGDQIPADEQDPYYDCFDLRDEDDDGSWSMNRFKQCSIWCYLDDLVRCSEDIYTISNKLLEKNHELKDWFDVNFDYLKR